MLSGRRPYHAPNQVLTCTSLVRLGACNDLSGIGSIRVHDPKVAGIGMGKVRNPRPIRGHRSPPGVTHNFLRFTTQDG